MSEGKYTILQMIGPAERDWVHVMHTQSSITLCSFTPSERALWTGNPIWDVRSPGNLKDCPDCLRKFKAMLSRGGGLP